MFNISLTQLEYIVSVDNFRHFAKAAENCFVTQPTLSMQIHKMEQELDVLIFDRSKKPVKPTPAGEKIIAQARIILKDAERIYDFVLEEKGVLAGDLKIGIIPTLSPYLLPLMLKKFEKNYPQIALFIEELTTGQIINALDKDQLDLGIVVTPLTQNLHEIPLFKEKMLAYTGKNFKKKEVNYKDLKNEKIWLLQEGHCLRNQVLNLCNIQKKSGDQSLTFESGSIETLLKMVDINGGITVIPELASLQLNAANRKKVKTFKGDIPVRQVSIVTKRHYIKDKLIEALKNAILDNIPAILKENESLHPVPVFQ